MRTTATGLIFIGLLAMTVAATLAPAETIRQGRLLVTFDGGIAPAERGP